MWRVMKIAKSIPLQFWRVLLRVFHDLSHIFYGSILLFIFSGQGRKPAAALVALLKKQKGSRVLWTALRQKRLMTMMTDKRRTQHSMEPVNRTSI